MLTDAESGAPSYFDWVLCASGGHDVAECHNVLAVLVLRLRLSAVALWYTLYFKYTAKMCGRRKFNY
jgi:hypothetical protein